MRLFVALDIAPIIRERVQHFVDEVRDSAPHARWIPVESLHVTLKFIGEVAPQKSDEIRAKLTATEELDAIPGAMELSLRGFGSSRTQHRPAFSGLGLSLRTDWRAWLAPWMNSSHR